MNLSLWKKNPNRKENSFTLVELLVVISIIGLLAGLGFPAIGGAMKAGKKAEVAAMAEQIKAAIQAFYSEYSAYPDCSSGKTDLRFLNLLSTSGTNDGNYRGIAFLEVPPKFTNAIGIVTPKGFYKGGAQSNFFVMVDKEGLGYVTPQTLSGSLPAVNVPNSVAVWVMDPYTNKPVGTFK